MKAKYLKGRLNQGLSTVRSVVPSTPIMPATTCVLFEADENGQTKLTTTDLQTTITTWVGGEVEEGGSFLLPASDFSDFVASLISEVNIEKRDDGIYINEAFDMSNIGIGHIKARFMEPQIGEFPPEPEVGEGVKVKFDAQLFANTLSRVLFAAAKEDARAVLTGVQFAVSDGNITFAAADGFRLSVDAMPCIESPEESSNVLVPGDTVKQLTRLIRKNISVVEMVIPKETEIVQFSLFEPAGEGEEVLTPETILYSHCVSGTFPDYEPLIPGEQPCTIILPIDALPQIVKHARAIGNEASIRIVAESGLPSRLSLLTESEEIGSSLGVVNAEIEGHPRKTAVNIRFLSELVNVLPATKDGKVTIGISDPGNAVLFKLPEYENFRHVLMPMHVVWEDEK